MHTGSVISTLDKKFCFSRSVIVFVDLFSSIPNDIVEKMIVVGIVAMTPPNAPIRSINTVLCDLGNADIVLH
jgi:formylmethanofuran dehydrogenase subunit B